MMRFITILLIVCITTVALFLASKYFGLLIITLAVIALLTLSFLSLYRKDGLGVELAYWGLTYAAFSIGFVGVGLLQSHAGCTFLYGACYQPTLPSWLWEFKMAFGVFYLVLAALIILSIPEFFSIPVRKLHKIGLSGWWLLLNLIPTLGSLYLLMDHCFYSTPSTPSTHSYGAGHRQDNQSVPPVFVSEFN